MLACITLLIIWLVRRHSHSGGVVTPAVETGSAPIADTSAANRGVLTAGADTTVASAASDTPIEIPRENYARGEIDKAEFEEKKKDLSD